MIPVINNGRSFKGAALYYRHDKQSADDARAGRDKPTSSDRVGFIVTRNLAHDAIDGSLAEMIGVCATAPLLKQQAGKSQGRPLTKPVKTIALSWHPDQQPTQEDMIRAADAFLAAMNWQQHQAILIEHRDTAHRHLHIILNRVHPDTGLTLDDSNDHRRAQAWAHQWDQSHGQEWCRDRARKYDRPSSRTTSKTTPSGMPRKAVDAAAASLSDFMATDRQLELVPVGSLAAPPLDRQHRAERDQFFDDRRHFAKALRSAVYARVKADARDDWRGHYRYARLIRNRANIEAAREARLARGLMRSAAALKSVSARDKQLARAEQHLEARARILADAQSTIADDRAALATEFRRTLRARQSEAAAAFANERYADFDEMQARHQDEASELAKLLAARDAGRRFDGKRLDALLAPVAKSQSPAEIDRRITSILDRLDAGERRIERRASVQQLPHGMAWQRRVNQALLQDFNTLTASLRSIAAAQDRGPDADPERQQRLDALVRELADAAERGARSVLGAGRYKDDRQRRVRVAEWLRESKDTSADELVHRHDRTAVALALCFDAADPFTSLAAAMAQEHAWVLEHNARLRSGMTRPEDAAAGERLDLERQHLLAGHLSKLAWRNGRLLEIMTGLYADARRGHTAATPFLDLAGETGGAYPQMQTATGAGAASACFVRHDGARADAAELRHALDRRRTGARQSKIGERGDALSARANAGRAQTQDTLQGSAEAQRLWIDRLRREQETYARTGSVDPAVGKTRRKAKRKVRRLSDPTSTAFRLADYETTRLWRRGEWRKVTRPPPVAVLHARGILHSSTDCPFCRLDWGRCPTHPK